MSQVKDIDYLFLSTRIKAMERNLLTGERMEQMLEARTVEESGKLLSECGYGEVNLTGLDDLDTLLTRAREDLFYDLTSGAPDKNILDVFKMKYDYHNVKVLLKAEAVGVEAEHLLVDAGRVPVGGLTEKVRASDLRGLPSILQRATQEAREVLGTTSDPQLADFVLDRAYFADMAELARKSESAFLMGYVRILVDAANLRSVVRTLRMGKGADFLKGVLFAGGNVDVNRIHAAVTSGSAMEDLFSTSAIRGAAEAGSLAINGGPLTQFEKLCDDAVNAYLSGAKYVAFGEAPLIGYLAAKESEFTNLRIIISGRLAGLSGDTIRERLRESYG